MSTISLNLESNAAAVLLQTSQKMGELGDSVEQFQQQGKAGMKAVANETEKLTNELKDGVGQTGALLKETEKFGKTANIYKELKKQARDYETQAYKAAQAGNKALGEELRIKAGKLRDDLQDLNNEAKALTGNMGENLGRAAGTSISLIARGFEGAASAQVLLGDKSKEFEETLLRLQALHGIAAMAQEFGGLSDKLTEIKLGVAPLKNLFVDGSDAIVSGYSNANNSLKTFFSDFSGNAKAAFAGAWVLIKDFGKNTISVAKNIGSGFVSFFSNFGTNMKLFATSAKNGINAIGTAMKANPLGVILTVITLVIGAMVALKDKVKPIADLFAWLGKIIDGITDAFNSLMEAIGLADDASEKKAKNTIKNSEAEIAAIEKRYDREIALLKSAGKDTADAEKRKYNETMKRIKATIEALYLKQLEEGKLNDEELKQLTETQDKMLDVMKDRQVELNTIQKEARDKEADDLDKKNKKAEADREKEKAKQEQAAKDLAQALLDIAKKASDAEIAGLNGKEKLDAQKKAADNEVSLLRENLIKKQVLAGEGNKLSLEVENEFQKLNLQNAKIYADALLQIEIDASRINDAELQKRANSRLEFLELQNRMDIAAVNKAQKPSGTSKEAWELSQNKKLLEIQKQFLIDTIDLKVNSFEVEQLNQIATDEDELLKLKDKNDTISFIRKQALNDEIDSIKKNTPLKVKVLKDENDAVIAGIDNSIDEANSKIKPIDWDALFGVPDGFLNKFKDEFRNFSNTIFDFANQQLDAELSVIDQRISNRDKDIEDLKSKLDIENDLRKQGLANNVDAINQQITAQELARKKDIDDQKKAQEEKKRLAKIQFGIDTAIQASNLVTAVTQVFADYAFPYSAILAALMVGSFVVAKTSAYKAIDKGQGFFKGGYTGDGATDKEAGVVHKQEFVSTAEDTKKHRTLFEGIHKKDKSLIEIGIRDLLKHTGVTLPQNAPGELSKMKSDARSHEINIMMPKRDIEHDNRMMSMEKNIAELVKQGNQIKYLNENGDLVIEKGNLTRIIKKKNEN